MKRKVTNSFDWKSKFAKVSLKCSVANEKYLIVVIHSLNWILTVMMMIVVDDDDESSSFHLSESHSTNSQAKKVNYSMNKMNLFDLKSA